MVALIVALYVMDFMILIEVIYFTLVFTYFVRVLPAYKDTWRMVMI